MVKFTKSLSVLLEVLAFAISCHCSDFRQDITSTFFGPYNEEMFPVAYGDFNADKVTDIFAVSKDGSELIIYFAQERQPILKLELKCKISPDVGLGKPKKDSVSIVGVSPGDFNGDGALDVMVAFHMNRVLNETYVSVLPGNLTTMECPSPLQTIKMVQEPFMLDMNGDNVMDLFGEVYTVPSCFNNVSPNCTKTKQYWLFEKGNLIIPKAINFTWIDPNVYFVNDDFPIPSVISFVDTNGDLIPELILTTCENIENGSKNSILYTMSTFEIQLSQLGDMTPTFKFINAIQVDKAKQVHIIGQSLFVDFNQNGKLMHVLPYSMVKNGKHSGLKVIHWSDDEDEDTFDLPIDFTDPDGVHSWHFVAPGDHSQSTSNYSNSVVLRVGDYNLDGYPDLIGVLVKTERASIPLTQAVLFENVPCEEKIHCKYPRTFKINFEIFSEPNNVILATFFDIHEDGLVDVILVKRTHVNTDPNNVTSGAISLQNSPSSDFDTNFMKVMVLSPQKCSLCPIGGVPYGNIISGPIIAYETRNETGFHQMAISAQMYRSSYLPMDLPYTIFVIGQSPNFIETLRVSVSPGKVSNHSREWLQIIPNSQIFVVPNPMNQPMEWKAKLFLTPSKAVLHTFGVLLGFCGIIGFIVIGLEYKERREDKNIRLEEANTFFMM